MSQGSRFRGRSPRWWALRVLGGLALLYGCFAAGMFAVQRKLVFPTWAVRRSPHPPPLPPGGEVWTRPLPEGGHAEAFFLPSPQVSPTAPGPAVAFFHGNGERTDDWVRPMSLYLEAGVSVLLVEYRGYNRAGGSPSREGLVEDARHFLDLLRADARVDPARLVLHGRSLGGGVACAVAASHPPAALILQSTFSRLGKLAEAQGLPAFLMRDDFDNRSAVAALDVPVFVAHGRNDQLIPFAHGEELARAAKRGRLQAYDTDHNDCPPDWRAYMEEVLGFLGEAGVLTAPPAPGGVAAPPPP